MGADQSTTGCTSGPRALFSLAEWREWKQKRGKGGLGSQMRVAGLYHVNQPLESKYTLAETNLGTGMSGPVRLARGKARTAIAHREFAVKTFKKTKALNLDQVKKEVMIFLSLDHPNIARLEDVFDCNTEIHLVMEKLEGGELFQRLVDRGAYAEGVAADACRSMCYAVAYLHSHQPPVVHRDLKPENFLYAKKDSNDLKLIDFGLSTFWDSSVDRRMSEYCGTAAYMAPEVQSRGSYTEKCDIFSLGVISYIMLTGHPPFASSLNMYAYSLYDQEKFVRLSGAARSFVRSFMAEDPSKRPSASQALESPWLRDGGQAPTATIDSEVLRSMRRFSTASRFRRACLNMMAWSLTSEDRSHLQACFEKMDSNGDGKISLSELRTALERNFDVNSAEATELFRNVDDGDDEICYSEFIAVAMHERVRMHEDALWATFSRIDRGNKGVITADDLSSILDDGFGSVDAEELLREVDRDGSGQVSCQAFVEYLTSWEDEAPGRQTQEEPRQEVKRMRTSLAARLIDREREREQLQAEAARPWKTFSPTPTRRVSYPLKRTGGRMVQSWAPA